MEKISGQLFHLVDGREIDFLLPQIPRNSFGRGSGIVYIQKKDPRSCVRNASAGKKIPGAVLLSHSQIYSTIAAGALNCRVREGNVCFCSAISTGKKSNSIKCLYWRDPLQRFNNSLVRVNSFPRASLRKPSEKRWLSLTAD